MNKRKYYILFIIVILFIYFTSCTLEKEKVVIASNYYPTDDIKNIALESAIKLKNVTILLLMFEMDQRYELTERRLTNNKTNNMKESIRQPNCEYYKNQPEAIKAVADAQNAGAKFLILSTPVPVDGKNIYDIRFSVVELQNMCYVHICPTVYRENITNAGIDIIPLKQIARELVDIIVKIE